MAVSSSLAFRGVTGHRVHTALTCRASWYTSAQHFFFP